MATLNRKPTPKALNKPLTLFGMDYKVLGAAFPVLATVGGVGDFLTAIQQWTAQQPGRHAQPGESKLQDAERKDPTVMITIHRTPAEKAADASA